MTAGGQASDIKIGSRPVHMAAAECLKIAMSEKWGGFIRKKMKFRQKIFGNY